MSTDLDGASVSVAEDCFGEPQTITKVRVFLETLEAKRASANEYLNKYEKCSKKVSTLMKNASNLEGTIASTTAKIEELAATLKKYKRQKAATLKKLQKTRRDLEEEKNRLNSIINSPIEDSEVTIAESVIAAASKTLSGEADLMAVHKTPKECNVCHREQPGSNIVYLSNCTHFFCKECVTRNYRKNRCMECRTVVELYFMIRKERKNSERCLIQYYDENFRRATLRSTEGQRQDEETIQNNTTDHEDNMHALSPGVEQMIQSFLVDGESDIEMVEDLTEEDYV